MFLLDFYLGDDEEDEEVEEILIEEVGVEEESIEVKVIYIILWYEKVYEILKE